MAQLPRAFTRRDMTRKIIGTSLIVIGIVGILVLLTYGGAIMPHIIGPSLLTLIGVLVLTVKGKASRSAS